MGLNKILKLAEDFEIKMASAYGSVLAIAHAARTLSQDLRTIIPERLSSEHQQRATKLVTLIGTVGSQMAKDSKSYGMSQETASDYKGYLNMLLAWLRQTPGMTQYEPFLSPLADAIGQFEPTAVYTDTPEAPPSTETAEEDPLGMAYEAQEEELPNEGIKIYEDMMDEGEAEPGAVGAPVDWLQL